MFNDHAYYMMGMHAIWWIFWLVAIVIFVFGLRTRRDASGESRVETPHQVLGRRLASGEIAADEYEQRVALLNRDA